VAAEHGDRARRETKYGDRIPAGHLRESPVVDVGGREVHISDHCQQRWVARAPAGFPGVGAALGASVPAHDGVREAFRMAGRDRPDEVRLYGAHGDRLAAVMVFIVIDQPNPTAVTCYRAASNYDYALRQYCRARVQAAGDFDIAGCDSS